MATAARFIADAHLAERVAGIAPAGAEGPEAEKTLSPEENENVQQIIRGGHHLLDLINEVLDISRIEAGHLAISCEPVRVSDVAHEAVEMIRPLAVARHVPISIDADLHHTPAAMVDRQRLKQILLNLCSNAVKYNLPNGDVQLSSATSVNGFVRIAVRDRGAGIPPEKLPLLFTPFERLGAEQTGVEGTGLGLALCKRLAEAMGGALSVESRVGAGSVFYLDLPTATASPEVTPEAPADPRPAAVAASSGQVLYIEDTQANARLMHRLMARREGVQLLHAADGDRHDERENGRDGWSIDAGRGHWGCSRLVRARHGHRAGYPGTGDHRRRRPRAPVQRRLVDGRSVMKDGPQA